MQRYDTILFDADGTLFDFLKGEREALTEACRRHGYELSEEDINDYSAINDSLWKALERKEVDKETLRVRRFELFCEKKGFKTDVNKLATDYTDSLSEQHFLICGALEIVKTLSEKCRLYIITNGISCVQRKRFTASPVNNYISELFISEDIGCEKPDVRYFEYVSEHISKFEKAKTLVVGDSLSADMKGGIAAGLDCCFFNPSLQAISEGMDINYNITKLSELEKIVLG